MVVWFFSLFTRVIHSIRAKFQEFSFVSVKIDVTDETCIEIKETVTKRNKNERVNGSIHLCTCTYLWANVTKSICCIVEMRWSNHKRTILVSHGICCSFLFCFYSIYKYTRLGIYIDWSYTSTADEMWTTPNTCARYSLFILRASIRNRTKTTLTVWRQSDSILFDFEFIYSLKSRTLHIP